MSWKMPGSNIFKRNKDNTLPAIPNEFKEYLLGTLQFLQKIKLKNFQGNQIVCLHLHFSTWKNTADEWNDNKSVTIKTNEIQ